MPLCPSEREAGAHDADEGVGVLEQPSHLLLALVVALLGREVDDHLASNLVAACGGVAELEANGQPQFALKSPRSSAVPV